MSSVDADIEKLSASLERLVTMVRRLTPSEGLSLTTVSTLRALEVSGPSRLSELAVAQGVTQPAMTQLVTRLERDGYAERGSSPEDARVVMVSLTRAGRELLQQRRRARNHVLRELLARLPEADREQILAALPAIDLLAELGQPQDRSRTR